MENEIIIPDGNQIQVPQSQAMSELSVSDVMNQVAKIQEIMRAAMKDGEHFGKIPGCGDKPTLLKPGAEKICFTFRLSPRYIVERIDFSGGHREYQVSCELYHIQSGQFVGAGVGSCSTMESKYRYRTGPKEYTGLPVPAAYWEMRKSNPVKAQDSLGGRGFSTGKNPDTGQWEICRQGEKVEHDNPADFYNTVLKMAKKRAHVDATLTATAASDLFTQDIEEMRENGVIGHPEPPKEEVPPQRMQPPQRKSVDSQPVQPPADVSGDAAELAVLCGNIASAGYTVLTDDYKKFRLHPTSEQETDESICVKLSTFQGRDGIVEGRPASALSAKQLPITLQKARDAWAGVQRKLSTNQAPPESSGWWCDQCQGGFDSPNQREINGRMTDVCVHCGNDDIRPMNEPENPF